MIIPLYISGYRAGTSPVQWLLSACLRGASQLPPAQRSCGWVGWARTPRRRVMALSLSSFLSSPGFRCDVVLTESLCCTCLALPLFYEHYIYPQPQLTVEGASDLITVDAECSSWHFDCCDGNPARKLNIWQKWAFWEIDESVAPKTHWHKQS